MPNPNYTPFMVGYTIAATIVALFFPVIGIASMIVLLTATLLFSVDSQTTLLCAMLTSVVLCVGSGALLLPLLF